MADKIIKTENSPQSINTIDQNGDNGIGTGGKPKGKSWWEKTRWLRWTLSFIVAAAAIIAPLLLK